MPDLFTFDEETHICRTPGGKWIPTVTQVMAIHYLTTPLKLIVDRDILDRRGRIGKEVHHLTDRQDRFGELDPSWLSVDTAGYVESWDGFKRAIKAKPIECSVRMCETIDGLQFTGELDNFMLIGDREEPAIVDKKTATTKSDGWGIQLAGYECLRSRSFRIGRYRRIVAQLNADGSPGQPVDFGVTSPIDGSNYADTFKAALYLTHWSIKRGFLKESYFLE